MSKTTAGGNTKHGELTRTLRELAQTLRPGDRFPSQAELMRRYEVSDRTLLRSLDDLQRAGWIIRRHGSGTFVADPGQRRPETPAATDSPVIAALTLTFEPGRFFSQHCLDLLSAQAESAGLSLVCHHAQNPTRYGDVLPLEALSPRGFVILNYTLAPIARRLREGGHRVVILGVPPADVYPDTPSVYGDHEHGGYLAAAHLLDLGHRRIAYARRGGGGGSLERSFRWQGHQRAIREVERAGETITVSRLDRDILDAWRATPALAADYFRRTDAPTAVAVWNDSEATDLLRLLCGAGVRVPDEVSVVGYDALPESEECLPPLTTVDQHLDRQMHAVVDLLTRSAPPPPTQSVVVLPTLVRRTSCAPPRTR